MWINQLLGLKMIIRTEQIKDYDAVYELTELAFKTMPFADGDEQDLVVRLRNSDAFIHDLSIVAEQDGNIVGHIMLTLGHIEHEDVFIDTLVLGPVSVHPEHQNKGIGSILIRESINRAKTLGYKSINLVGHEKYYPRFGFKPASDWGIKMELEVPDQNFMFLELFENSLKNSQGLLKYPKEFNLDNKGNKTED